MSTREARAHGWRSRRARPERRRHGCCWPGGRSIPVAGTANGEHRQPPAARLAGASSRSLTGQRSGYGEQMGERTDRFRLRCCRSMFTLAPGAGRKDVQVDCDRFGQCLATAPSWHLPGRPDSVEHPLHRTAHVRTGRCPGDLCRRRWRDRGCRTDLRVVGTTKRRPTRRRSRRTRRDETSTSSRRHCSTSSSARRSRFAAPPYARTVTSGG